VACEDVVPEVRRRLAEYKRSVPQRQHQQRAGTTTAGAYLPWTLDVERYPRGTCQVTGLARSFEEARRWAKQSLGWIDVLSVNEEESKIAFTYYDGLVKAKSVRVFYKDMVACKAERS